MGVRHCSEEPIACAAPCGERTWEDSPRGEGRLRNGVGVGGKVRNVLMPRADKKSFSFFLTPTDTEQNPSQSVP